MKTELTQADKIEIAKLAPAVVQQPDSDGFWSQVADFFDHNTQAASEIVEPRPSSGTE